MKFTMRDASGVPIGGYTAEFDGARRYWLRCLIDGKILGDDGPLDYRPENLTEALR